MRQSVAMISRLTLIFIATTFLATSCSSVDGELGQTDGDSPTEGSTEQVEGPSTSTTTVQIAPKDVKPESVASDAVVGPKREVEISVPPGWDQRMSIENGAGGVRLEATVDELDFAVGGAPGMRITTGDDIWTDADLDDLDTFAIFFGPSTDCESNRIPTPYESTTLPGHRFDYSDCGPGGDLKASMVLLEPTDQFQGGIVNIFVGANDPTIEDLLARIQVDQS